MRNKKKILKTRYENSDVEKEKHERRKTTKVSNANDVKNKNQFYNQ